MGKNALAANMLYEIADLLELQQVLWKPAAYRKAALAVESSGEDVEDVYAAEGVAGLMKIPGVGENIAQKLGEIVSTGRLAYLEKLRAAFPFDMQDLTRIPGMGPKKAKKLFDSLGIRNADELKAAAEAGRVRGVEGFGAKSEQALLRGIALVEKSRGRMLLGFALDEIDALVAAIKAHAPVERISPAGSVRRMKETIGDLDILATSRDPAAVMGYFTSLPEVDRVVARGTTKSSVVMKSGLAVDVRVVKDAEYGSALQYFTGSKEHNIALRKLAISKGLKLSEYGLFKGTRRVAGRTEEEIYRALGLDVMPPEMREDNGELKAAAGHALPDLVGYGEMKGDFHVHSNWSDGQLSVELMARAAKERGYEYFALTDHAGTLAVARALNARELADRAKEIEAAEKKVGIRIFKGAEVDINKDGTLAIGDGALAKLDYIVAAVHSSFWMPEAEMTARVIRGMENRYVTALAHPSARLIGSREPISVSWEKVYAAAAANGVRLEINAFPERMDLPGSQVKAAKDGFGAKFAIGTDAHNAAHLRFIRLGVAIARRGWLEKKDVLNAQPLTAVEKALAP